MVKIFTLFINIFSVIIWYQVYFMDQANLPLKFGDNSNKYLMKYSIFIR